MGRLMKIVSLVIVATLLFHSSKNTVYLSIKVISPKTFTTLFCENAEIEKEKKLETHCDGNCKLMKMTKEQQDDKSSTPLVDFSKEFNFYHEQPLSIQSFVSIMFEPQNSHFFKWENLYLFHFFHLNLRPPIGRLV